MIFLLTMVVVFVIIFYQTFKINYGLGLDFMIKIAPPVLGYTLPWVLIISSVLGATLCYSRLSSDNEIIAMKTSGFHTLGVIYPSIVWGCVLAALSVYINESVVPKSLGEQRRLAKEEISYLFKNPPPSKQAFPLSLCLISYSQASGRVLKNVTIDDLRKDESYSAPEAIIEVTPEGVIQLVLKKCLVKFKPVGDRRDQLFFEEHKYTPPSIEIAGMEQQPLRSKYLSSEELLYIANNNFHEREKIRAATEYHLRYSNSASIFGLVVISSIFGIFVRSSSRLAGIGVTIPILVLFLIFSKQFEGLSFAGKISPLTVYIPAIALILLAILLYLRIKK